MALVSLQPTCVSPRALCPFFQPCSSQFSTQPYSALAGLLDASHCNCHPGGQRDTEVDRTQRIQPQMQPYQLLIVPPQRELRRRLHPQPVPPKQEGSCRSHHGLTGQPARFRQPDHQGEEEERHSSGQWLARRFFETRASRAANSSFLWQLWSCSFVQLTNPSPHALHTSNGKKTTERPSVRAVNLRSFVTNSHQLLTASYAPRDVRLCSLVAPMSGGSSSDWWNGWEWRGE